MRPSRAAIIALAALACVAGVRAAESPIPPPPEDPPWIEPVPLTAQLQVTAHSCDDYQDEPTKRIDLTPQWLDDGRLRLTGAVQHNGGESLASNDVSAWQVGDRIVITYVVQSHGFPEGPFMACLGHTHLDITLPRLPIRPKKFSVYAGRIEYSEPVELDIPRR